MQLGYCTRAEAYRVGRTRDGVTTCYVVRKFLKRSSSGMSGLMSSTKAASCFNFIFRKQWQTESSKSHFAKEILLRECSFLIFFASASPGLTQMEPTSTSYVDFLRNVLRMSYASYGKTADTEFMADFSKSVIIGTNVTLCLLTHAYWTCTFVTLLCPDHHRSIIKWVAVSVRNSSVCLSRASI